jgi:hypothetical protein
MSETPETPRRPPASSAAGKKSGVSKLQRGTEGKRLPPNAGKGRRKGVPNRLTADEKALIANLVNFGLARAQGWLDRVGRKSPARALTITTRLAEFIVPKLRSTELTGAGGTPLPMPSFSFTMPHGGPGTEGPQGSTCDVEVSGEHGSEDEQLALPPPSSEPDVPVYMQHALPAPTQEQRVANTAPEESPPVAPPARRVQRAHPETFEDPQLVAEADQFEQRRAAGIPQSRPRPQVELLLYARERRRRQEARGEALDADFYVAADTAAPTSADAGEPE